MARDDASSPLGVTLSTALRRTDSRAEEMMMRAIRHFMLRLKAPGKAQRTAMWPETRAASTAARAAAACCQAGGERLAIAMAAPHKSADAVRCQGGGQASLKSL